MWSWTVRYHINTRQWWMLWATLIQSALPRLPSVISILTDESLTVYKRYLPSRFPIKILFSFPVLIMRATYPGHLIRPYFLSLTDVQYNFWGSSLRNLLWYDNTFSLSHANSRFINDKTMQQWNCLQGSNTTIGTLSSSIHYRTCYECHLTPTLQDA
jgi:hypothetical protein